MGIFFFLIHTIVVDIHLGTLINIWVFFPVIPDLRDP